MQIGHGHVLHLDSTTATLVLSGRVTTRDVTAIRRQCRAIPERVRTLHLDLVDVPHFEGSASKAVRGVVRDWRRARRGACSLELRSPLLVARVDHDAVASPRRTRVSRVGLQVASAPAADAAVRA